MSLTEETDRYHGAVKSQGHAAVCPYVSFFDFTRHFFITVAEIQLRSGSWMVPVLEYASLRTGNQSRDLARRMESL